MKGISLFIIFSEVETIPTKGIYILGIHYG